MSGSHLGDYELNTSLYLSVATSRYDTGAAADASSGPSYRVYNAANPTPLLTGTMSVFDDSNTTGLYVEEIELSEGNGFSVNDAYAVYIQMTVNGVVQTEWRTFRVARPISEVVTEAVNGSLFGVFLTEGLFVGDTGNDATHIHIPGLGSEGHAYADDDLNDYLLVIQSSSGDTHARWIEDWDQSSELATVDTLPFTPEEGNSVIIMTMRRDVTGGSGLDAAGVRAAIGLATANLDTQLAAIDDAVDTEVAAIKAKTDNLPSDPADQSLIIAATDAIMAAIGALNNLSAAQVNAEVVDALATDTYAEPTGVPAATATLASKLGFLHMALRNRVDVSATKKQFYDDGGAVEWEKDLSDDGTTYSESEANAP